MNHNKISGGCTPAKADAETQPHIFPKVLGEYKTNHDQGSNPYRKISVRHTQFLCSISEDSCPFTPQSGVTDDASIMKVGGKTQYENVQFSDQHDPYLYDVENSVDPTRTTMDTKDASLEHFFSRPIKIIDSDWAVGTSFYESVDPWALYFGNKRVVNRLANFNLLRANLHIKIIINGNGFQFGRLIASYLPFFNYDTLTSNAGLVSQDIVQASQLPHVYLDPTTSSGGELKLPFFYHKNYVNVAESGWDKMGQLIIRSINDLKHANGANDRSTISVFAWAEDVSTNVLTSVEPTTLVPQSGTEIDEANSKGAISGPATAVAKAAGVLKFIPAIAPFAIATEAGANVVSNIAKALGYSRPLVTKDPEPFKPVGISSMAVTTVPDGAAKLTLDDKQELSIDPRIAGLGSGDPMSIRAIAKRESYLTTFSWPIGVPTESLLWNSRISPVLWAESAGSAMHFPACAMAALPFKYWTGSMRFRFQIVCSAFHKGRIKIVYDPNFFASNEYNTNYLQIIDIADMSDFSVEIGNGQDVSLLDHALPGRSVVSELYSTTPYISKAEGNGVLGIYVVNELTTPNSDINNDIQVNVFVSMGDDFEVFVPDDHFQRLVFKPQSGEEIVSEAQNTEEPSAPQHSETEKLGPSQTNHDLLAKVFCGESIASFRPLLKRYNLHSSLTHLNGSSARVAAGRQSMFPFLRGHVAGAIHATDLGQSYNYCNTVMLHWVTLAHSGWRGSIRWKITPRGEIRTERKPVYYIQRGELGVDEYSEQSAPMTNGYDTLSQLAASTVLTEISPSYVHPSKPLSGVRGLLLTSGFVNPNCEFEVPYYSKYRFTPGKVSNYTQTSIWTPTWDYRIFADGDYDTSFDTWCAAGEDFQVYFFTGLPRMYYEMDPPTPLPV